MSGYKSKIIINNLDSIKDILANKTINKATINFTTKSPKDKVIHGTDVP